MSITPTSSESDAVAAAEGLSSRWTARTAAVEKAKEETGKMEVDAEITSAWGRKANSDWPTALGALIMMTLSPFVVWFFLWSCAEHDCSLSASGSSFVHLLRTDPAFTYSYLWNVSKIVTSEATTVWLVWLAAQALLYTFMPGPQDHGQPTPAGHTLRYVVNGLNVWITTHLTVVALLCVMGYEAATIVPRNWMGLFWISNIAGWSLTILVYLKARLAPTHAADNKWSGSLLYDLFMGVEHNPRFNINGFAFDLKLFFNGRPGICAWTLINLCFACEQYRRFGFVSSGMVLLNILHAVYVLDFFYHESWYLRTIDICHDHFGFYLSWGDLCWLPFMYTLQGLYLSTHPVQLSPLACVAVLSLGMGGYCLFRAVNAAKDNFRKEMKRLDSLAHSPRGSSSGVGHDGEQKDTTSAKLKQEDAAVLQPSQVGTLASNRDGISVYEIPYLTWGRPTRYLTTRYLCHSTSKIGGVLRAGDEVRQSYLLLSGFWGCSRHFNYAGDLMLSLAMCLTCGFDHLLPYFYIFYMTALLVHRVARDDAKCTQKYGNVWRQYCRLVPYKIIPYVY